MVLILLILTSCININKVYNEDFNGLWRCEQESFKPLANEVVLSITKDKVIVDVDGVRGEGRYYVRDGQLIVGWAVRLEHWDMVLFDATLTHDDKLLFRWKPTGYFYAFTTIFERIVE